MIRLVSLCAVLVLGSACEVVAGSGSLATEAREVGRFDGVRLTSSVDATVRLSQDDHAVELVCDDNLLQHIELTVRNEELHVSVANNIVINPAGECQALISAPDLRSFSLSASGDLTTTGNARDVEEISSTGSGTLTVEDVSATQLAIDLTGSGRIEVSGSTRQVDIFSSGSGDLDAERLDADDAEVRSTGSGDVELTANDSVVASLSGSGSVTVHGSPSDVDESVTGSGELIFD